MKIKDKIKVLGCDVKIEYFKDDGRSPNMGSCNSFLNKIKLCEDNNIDQQSQTLLHEIMHKINDDLALGITETNIAGLSAVLYSVLKENPGIIK